MRLAHQQRCPGRRKPTWVYALRLREISSAPGGIEGRLIIARIECCMRRSMADSVVSRREIADRINSEG
jgi:hypothetical protein